MENNLKISVDSKLENVGIVRVAVASFISMLDIKIDDLMDVKTAVSEAVTNSIEHAYLTNNGKVDVYVNILNNIINIQIEDYGMGIEDLEMAMTTAYTSKPEKEHAGLGFTIMEAFMDEVIVDSKKDQGTKIFMRKELKNII